MKPRHVVPLAALAAYFAVGLAWLAGGRRAAESVHGAGSHYERSALGTSLAYEYLARRGHPVSTLAEDLRPGVVPDGAVVFRIAAAARGRDALLETRERDWVARGGRLVLALGFRYGPLDVAEVSAKAPVKKVFPAWPGVEHLYPEPARGFDDHLPPEAVTLFAVGRERLVVRWTAGRGEVVALACPEIFENGRISAGDHLLLLESLAGRGRPVLFDERVHGAPGPGLLAVLLEWRLGPALVLGTASLLLAFWRSRARQGPPEDDYEETRSDAVDLVDSLAVLYDRALTRGQLLAQYHDAFRRATSLRTGLRGRALEERVRKLMGNVRPPAEGAEPSAAEFDRVLAAVNQAFQRMEDHAHTR
jgi:hypothetical protein